MWQADFAAAILADSSCAYLTTTLFLHAACDRQGPLCDGAAVFGIMADDWGLSDDEQLDWDALNALEQQALAERQPTATSATGSWPTASGGPPARGAAQEPQAPRNAAELRHRCRLFHQAPLPPPKPPRDRYPRHSPTFFATSSGAALPHPCVPLHVAPYSTSCPICSCPGVYGRGCSGALQAVRWSGDGSLFWACSKWPDCAYREFPPPVKLAPELCITLGRKHGTIEVAAMPGAEAAVQYCGGVRAVLGASGVDLRRALVAQQQDPPVDARIGKPASAETGDAATTAACWR